VCGRVLCLSNPCCQFHGVLGLLSFFLFFESNFYVDYNFGGQKTLIDYVAKGFVVHKINFFILICYWIAR
jgi:hypothetical protein